MSSNDDKSDKNDKDSNSIKNSCIKNAKPVLTVSEMLQDTNNPILFQFETHISNKPAFFGLRALVKQAQLGDKAATTQVFNTLYFLIHYHMKDILYGPKTYVKWSSEDIEDIQSEASLALMRAIHRFNCDLNPKAGIGALYSYSSKTIRNAIYKYLQKTYKDYKYLDSTADIDITRNEDIQETTSAVDLLLVGDVYNKIQALLRQCKSLFELADNHAGQRGEDIYAKAPLTRNEYNIIIDYFLDPNFSDRTATLKVLSQKYGMSPQTVHNIKNTALNKIRKYLGLTDSN